jgi:hypothetical protein
VARVSSLALTDALTDALSERVSTIAACFI